MVLRVGLTGGIGSGKSTVAALLARHGAHIIDADAIARASTAPGGAAIAQVRTTFGTDLLTAEGALDRKKMRELIFADATARARLEEVIHPLVRTEMYQQALSASLRGESCILFDIPLLVESGHWRKLLDQVLVVDCSQQTQIERVMHRDGLSAVEIQRILVSQASRQSRLRIADLVLFNDAISVKQLAHQVGQIAAEFGL